MAFDPTKDYITREEKFLTVMAGNSDINFPEPITRFEHYLAAMCDSDNYPAPAPITRLEHYLSAIAQKIAEGGGGGGEDTWSWMGKNPTLVKDYDLIKVYLKDSPYATWTPTTTSTTLANSTNMEQVTGLDLHVHDYVITYRWHTHYEYDGTETGMSLINDYYYANNHFVGGYAGNLTNMVNGTVNSNQSTSIANALGTFYKNASGGDSYDVTSVGVYISSLPTPLVSQSLTELTPKIPTIYAKCIDSYFTPANASAVDQDKSYYELKVQVYQVDFGTTPVTVNRNAIRDMWLNGI